MPDTGTGAWRRETFDDAIDTLLRDLATLPEDPDDRRARLRWIAGLNGILYAQEADGAFHMELQRERVNRANHIRITHAQVEGRRIPDALRDTLAWHIDQDTRQRPLHSAYNQEAHLRMPRGPLMLDPLLAIACIENGVDENDLRYQIMRANSWSDRAWSEVFFWDGPIYGAKVGVYRNELRAITTIGITEMPWSNGCLTIDLGSTPATVINALKGQKLSTVISHPVLDLIDVKILGISQLVDGRHTIATSAAKSEGLVPFPDVVARSRRGRMTA